MHFADPRWTEVRGLAPLDGMKVRPGIPRAKADPQDACLVGAEAPLPGRDASARACLERDADARNVYLVDPPIRCLTG